MVLHLLLALHKDKGSIRRGLIFARLRNEPTLGLLISNVAMVGRDSLKLDLHFTSHGSADGEIVIAVDSLKDDLFLDQVLVLVGADPSGASAKSGRILLILVDLLNFVVAGIGPHDEECFLGLLRGHRLVSNLVKVVVDHFAEIDESVLLDLYLGIHVYLYT